METSQSWIANVAILNKLLATESWYNTFWAPFSGNVDISSDDNGNNVYRPSGKPIEILSDFVAQGRDNMLIPFLSDLTGSPVFGDTVLKGTGEDQTMKWLRSFVNQQRKAVMKRSGQMSEQRQKLYKLYDEARPQLARWFTKWENMAVFQAMYEGCSPNLSYGTNSDGLGLAKRYHPNWYSYTASGTWTAIGTEKAFKTNAQLDGALVHGGGSNEAAADLDAVGLRALRVLCMELKIPQIVTKSGHRFWAMVCHPQTMTKLYADTAFTGAQREAYSQKMLALPELTGAVAHYAGFCLYEDIIGIREWDGSTVGADGLTGTFMGATTTSRFTPTSVGSSSKIYNSVIFGNGAMGKGVASNLHFTNEIDDHANTIEVGAAAINGYNRADFVAESVAGTGSLASTTVFSKDSATAQEYATATAAVNQSSLIVATDDV